MNCVKKNFKKWKFEIFDLWEKCLFFCLEKKNFGNIFFSKFFWRISIFGTFFRQNVKKKFQKFVPAAKMHSVQQIFLLTKITKNRITFVVFALFFELFLTNFFTDRLKMFLSMMSVKKKFQKIQNPIFPFVGRISFFYLAKKNFGNNFFSKFFLQKSIFGTEK
jgi:hypothetical protein